MVIGILVQKSYINLYEFFKIAVKQLYTTKFKNARSDLPAARAEASLRDFVKADVMSV